MAAAFLRATSSMCVEIVHVLPNGSRTRPSRAPRNISVMGLNGLAEIALFRRSVKFPRMKPTRRSFLQTIGATSFLARIRSPASATEHSLSGKDVRRFHFVQIDVFTSRRLRGNPLSVFTDGRGLSDSEMQGLAKETNLQETTFVLPREAAVESPEGVKVRIFTTEEEIPFGGHSPLGTATVLRNLHLAGSKEHQSVSASEVLLDLKVGKVPVSFREDADGTFGEMRQVSPSFGPVHDRSVVAEALGLESAEIEPDLPVQTVSTGLPFAIVPIKRLSTLQTLQFDLRKAYDYLKRQQTEANDFYFIARDTGDPKVGLRARGIYSNRRRPSDRISGRMHFGLDGQVRRCPAG